MKQHRNTKPSSARQPMVFCLIVRVGAVLSGLLLKCSPPPRFPPAFLLLLLCDGLVGPRELFVAQTILSCRAGRPHEAFSCTFLSLSFYSWCDVVFEVLSLKIPRLQTHWHLTRRCGTFDTLRSCSSSLSYSSYWYVNVRWLIFSSKYLKTA